MLHSSEDSVLPVALNPAGVMLICVTEDKPKKIDKEFLGEVVINYIVWKAKFGICWFFNKA